MYADVNGLHLYYEVHGPAGGRPLVLLHGGLLTIDVMFEPWLPVLTGAGHRVIGVELQGHGRTADTDRPMSFDALADDVVALLDHLQVDTADVIGFSLGGIVGWSLGVRHPGRVGRLAILSADYRRRDAELDAELPTEADFAAMRAGYEAVAPDPAHFEAFAQKTSTMVNQDFVGWTDEEIAGIANPILVVVGDRDFVRVTDAVEAYGLLPDGQLAVLPATTHMAMTRSPERLLALLMPFFDRGDGGRPT